jgi:hypothetical protein
LEGTCLCGFYGYQNVIIEIANEVMMGHYHHDILEPGRVVELVHRARDRAQSVHNRRLLVSTSEAMLRRGVSFGLHSDICFQSMFPPKWGVWENETLWFFRRVRELTRPD